MKHALAAFAALVLAVPGVALADAKQEAQKHIDRATKLHGDSKFAEALEELTTAYTLDPRPELLYAIAQVHVQLGSCSQAITFYERFLSTKPAAGPAGAAREAIQTCKAAPPDATKPDPDPVPDPDPQPDPDPIEDDPLPDTRPITEQPASGGAGPWYTDKLGVALLGGGVALGAVSVVFYLGARGKLDDADAAATYAEHLDLVDQAESKRTIAAGLAIGSVALVGAGLVRYMLRDTGEERQVAITPTTSGGLITWMGRF